MTPVQAQLVETVRQRFGEKAVTTDAETIAPWLSDWRGRYRGDAPAMLTPGSRDEVAAMVALAAQGRV
ncbi:MAG: FAD-binding oxidoreductase, partial [Sphingomonadales bacterium]